MHPVVCRRPTSDEAETLCCLITDIVSSSFPAFPETAIKDYLEPWTAERVAVRLSRGHDILLVGLVGNEMVGLASGHAPEAGVGTIVWLLVASGWRNRRIGQALYSAACDAYRDLGAHKIKLTAPSDDAKRFYERCGMRVEGFHPNHWYGLDFFSLGADLCDRRAVPMRNPAASTSLSGHEGQ